MIRSVARRLPESIRAPLRRAYRAIIGAPRPVPSQPSRHDILLSGIERDGLGLEIGPSHNPVAPRSGGFRVEIVDLCGREALIEKYAGQGVDLDAIEEVDFIWDGRSLADRTGRGNAYDWIIASHVIEHVPDLAGFLNDCDGVLRDDGVLSLAIPDKRYCFDRMRAPTGIQALVDAHLERRTNHTAGQVADYFLNVVALAGEIGWSVEASGGRGIGDFAFVHAPDQAREGLRAVADTHARFDIHAWCFTPSSFRLLMDDLYHLGLVRLRESFFLDRGSEFFVRMSRLGTGPGVGRMELLRRIDGELAAVQLRGAG